MCASAAARALRHDVGTEEIALCIPEDFAEFANHLEGPDRVVSLGPLSEIRPVRRRRDTPMDPNQYPYLRKVFSLPHLRRVEDLYCLAGDTKISLVDGTEVPIQKLAKRTKSFWVYAYDHSSDKIVPGKASAKKTRRRAKLVEIALDNKETIRCTPDHLFLLRNGKYKKAENLVPGDSLMPLRRKYDSSYLLGYELLWQPKDRSWHFTHREFKLQHRRRGQVVHHTNYNPRDNRPENLQCIDRVEHTRIHKWYQWFRDPQQKKCVIKKLRLAWRRDPSRRRRLRERQSGESNTAKRPEVRIKIGDTLRGRKLSPETKEKLHFALLNREITAEHAAKIGNALRGRPKRTDVTLEKIMKLRHLGFSWRQIVFALGTSYNVVYRRCGSVNGRCRPVSTNGSGRRSRIGSPCLFVDGRMPANHNHKVVSVKNLPYRRDCYDLSVKRYHNFALTSGVFSHNCPAFLNEISAGGTPRYSRSQLFAMAAGASQCLDAKPVWRIDDADRNMARKILCGYRRPWLVCQTRATCTARSLALQQSRDLIKCLTSVGTVFYADCCPPRHTVPLGMVALIDLPWPVLAAIVSFSDLVVCVDSALLHLAAATGTSAVALFGPSSGEAVTASYYNVWPLEGFSDRCSRPCCYIAELGWDRKRCRSDGCCRMAYHDPKAVAAGVRVALGFARREPPPGAEVPASAALACGEHGKGGFSGS